MDVTVRLFALRLAGRVLQWWEAVEDEYLIAYEYV